MTSLKLKFNLFPIKLIISYKINNNIGSIKFYNYGISI